MPNFKTRVINRVVYSLNYNLYISLHSHAGLHSGIQPCCFQDTGASNDDTMCSLACRPFLQLTHYNKVAMQNLILTRYTLRIIFMVNYSLISEKIFVMNFRPQRVHQVKIP